MTNKNKMLSFTIDDNLKLQNKVAIEVTILFNSGKKRWCYFTNPKALKFFGEHLNNTNVRIHYGSPHIIIVSKTITEKIINDTLKYIDSRGELLNCTINL